MEDNPPKTPAATSSADVPMADTSPPKYVPQFSAATEMILKRINSGAGTSSFSSIGITGTPPGYEDMRRSVLLGMKTSMNMEIPSTPVGNNKGRSGSGSKSAGSTGGKARASSNSTPRGAQHSGGSAGAGKGKTGARSRAKAGSKRKRVQEEESESSEESDTMSKLGGDSDSDGSGSISELPKITQSGRQVNKPAQFVPASYEAPARKRSQPKRNQEQALCKRCGRGHSPQNNMIVFCDGCNLGWHQQCHDPVISEEAVKDETAPWFCADCSRKRGVKPGAVSWQGRSTDDKRKYFNTLPQQQLVSLLMQATVLYPNIPIFPAAPTTQLPSFVPPVSKTASSRQNSNSLQSAPAPAASSPGLFSRSDSNPNAPMNFIRKIPSGSTPPLNSSSTSNSNAPGTQAASAPPTLNLQGGNGDSRESTPASPPYPKPGNGLMAKLGPDEEDLEWLVDDNDFDAFSHTIYDENGIAHVQAEENGDDVNGISTHDL